MGLKLIPMFMRCLLGPLALSGPILGLIATLNSVFMVVLPTCLLLSWPEISAHLKKLS